MTAATVGAATGLSAADHKTQLTGGGDRQHDRHDDRAATTSSCTAPSPARRSPSLLPAVRAAGGHPPSLHDLRRGLRRPAPSGGEILRPRGDRAGAASLGRRDRHPPPDGAGHVPGGLRARSSAVDRRPGAVLLTVLRFIQGVGVGGEWGRLRRRWPTENGCAYHRGARPSGLRLQLRRAPRGPFPANLAVPRLQCPSRAHSVPSWGLARPVLPEHPAESPSASAFASASSYADLRQTRRR